MTTSPIDLSICVLHYNRWDLTKDCLTSIDAQEIPCSYEKVLIDNGSTEPLLPLAAGWRLVRYEQNRGHIVGQNRCFESAQGKWVLFVANDVRLHLNCVNELWRNGRMTSINQPLLFTTTGQIDNGGLDWKWPGYGISRRTGFFSKWNEAMTSTCYLMKKDIWNSIGGFDETLQSSHEDVDFSLRARYQGHLISCDPHATVTHLGNATLKNQNSHNRQTFHRDRVYVITKHYRGFSRLLRLAAVCLLDSVPRW